MLIETEGDLFSNTALAIGHGVNRRGLMGAGIAVAFKQKFPLMYEQYALMCNRQLLPMGEVFPYYVGDGRWVYNLVTQDAPGPNANLYSVQASVMKAMRHANDYGVPRIAIPQVGCGIGGLRYEDVRKVLNDVAHVWHQSVDLEIVTYKP
jgi:O-acetyl-ADP-ribose deacetylase (regulator of RNase III)